MLSLGGSIIPIEVSHYDTFQYQGMVSSADDQHHSEGEKESNKTNANDFAEKVKQRAAKKDVSRPTMTIGYGMLLQFFAIIAIILACIFLQNGAVLTYWCEVYLTLPKTCSEIFILIKTFYKFPYWMFIWYLAVCTSAILENFAGVPFTHTWTVRVWRVPTIETNSACPWVIPRPPERSRVSLGNISDTGYSREHEPALVSHDIPRKPVAHESSRLLNPYPRSARPTIGIESWANGAGLEELEFSDSAAQDPSMVEQPEPTVVKQGVACVLARCSLAPRSRQNCIACTAI